jgi:predicted ATP-grasp superfamily ATP-dependent carboligase
MSCEVNVYTIEKRKENQGILVVGVDVVEVVDSRIRIGRRVK